MGLGISFFFIIVIVLVVVLYKKYGRSSVSRREVYEVNYF